MSNPWDNPAGNPWDKQKSSTPRLPKKEEAWYEDFAEGLGVSGLKLLYGAKDLIPGLEKTEANQATLDDWKADAAESGWGTAGEVAGEIAQMAIPVTKLAKIPKLYNVAKASPLLADAAKAVTLAGVRDPGEGSRGDAMTLEGLLSAVGGGAGRVGSKLFRGADTTKAADQVFKEGGYLTPAQATEGGLSSAVENLMSFLPFTAKGTHALRDKAQMEYSERAIKSFAPDPAGITAKGEDAIAQLETQIKDRYKVGWGTGDMTEDSILEFTQDLAETSSGLPKYVQRKFKKVADDSLEMFDGGHPNILDKIDSDLKKIAKSAKGDQVLLEDIANLRAGLKENLTEEGVEILNKTDAIYPDFLAAQKASKAAHLRQGNFTPKQHSTASSAVGGKSAGAGKRPSKKRIKQGLDTLGHELASPPLSRMLRIMTAVPSPQGVMKGAGKAWLGNTKSQKLIAELLKKPGARPFDPSKVAPSLATIYGDD